MSETRLKKTKAFEKSSTEAIAATATDDADTTEITEEFLKTAKEQDEGKITLDKEGQATEIVDVVLKRKETDTEKAKIKQKLYKEQTKESKGTGSAEIRLTRDGKEVSTKEAEAQTQQEQEKLEQKIAEKAQEKVAKKEGAKDREKGVFDISERMAAARKAREKVEEETAKKIERPAA